MRLEVPVRSGATTDIGEHGRGGPGAVSGGRRGGDVKPGEVQSTAVRSCLYSSLPAGARDICCWGFSCREDSRRYMLLRFLIHGGHGSFPFFDREVLEDREFRE